MLLYDAFYMYSDIMLFMIPWYIKNIIWCFVMYNNDGWVTCLFAACVSCVILPCLAPFVWQHQMLYCIIRDRDRELDRNGGRQHACCEISLLLLFTTTMTMMMVVVVVYVVIR